MSATANDECVEKGGENPHDEDEEEVWELPQDFNLYSKHEVRRIYFPSTKKNCINNGHKDDDDDDGGDDDGNDNIDETTKCTNGRHSFQIECLEPSSPLDITNKSESDAEKYDATGHCVWTGAFLLIQCMDDIAKVVMMKNKRIIELGCGTGIGGLAMTMFADADFNANATSCGNGDSDANARHADSVEVARPQSICFTDTDPAALEVCRRNCELNGMESSTDYSIRELTWGVEEDISETLAWTMTLFDIALATDVLYEVELCDPLFTTVARCIPVGATFILSHVPRACYNEGNPPEAVKDLEQYIIDKAREHGLHLEHTIRPPDPNDLHEEILSWCSKDSFLGSSVLIFCKMDR